MVNITNKVNIKDILKKIIIDYFKKTGKDKLIKEIKNIDIYKEDKSIDLPFRKYCFYNKSEKDINIELQIISKQSNKCSCFYYDEFGKESDDLIIIIIKPKSFETCLVLPYGIESKFEISLKVFENDILIII